MPEAGELREDEPHPVALLPAALQLGKHARVDRFLRIEEALEIEGIGHGRGPHSMSAGHPVTRTGTITIDTSAGQSSNGLKNGNALKKGKENGNADLTEYDR
jgi:hypothetical protein